MNARLPVRTTLNARVLQLASQSLPTGAFAYSGGLEALLDLGWLAEPEQFYEFLETLLEMVVQRLEVPVAVRILAAYQEDDLSQARLWSQRLRAQRETREFAEQDAQMGRALGRVLAELFPELRGESWVPLTYTEALARAARLFGLTREELALVVAYNWVEQHVSALARLIPLGPIAGQKLMSALIPAVERVASKGLSTEDDDIGASAPILAIASALHEEQYTRIFRS